MLPEHITGADGVTVIAGGCVITTAAVAVQPFASVTVAVYVPAVRAVVVLFVPPLGLQLYVYAGVPPPAVTVALPLLPPLHVTGEEAVITAVNTGGCVIVVDAVILHPFASFTVTVYVPTERLLAVALVPPLGAHA